MSVDIVRNFFSRSLKRARENTSMVPPDISKCAEVFVRDTGDRWTYFCVYCEKTTNDIGNFICHIRLDHLNTPQRQSLSPIETEVNVFTPIATSIQSDPNLIQPMPPLQINTSGDNVRRSFSTPLKKARESTSLAPSSISKCAEVFVTDIGDRWTFFCAYCEKATNDIGNFICHIRLDHLNAPQLQSLEQSVIEKKVNVFTTIGSSIQSDPNLMQVLPTLQIASVFPKEKLPMTNGEQKSPSQNEIFKEEETIVHSQENVQIICSKIFNIIEDTMNEPGKTVRNDAVIALDANDSAVVSSQQDNNQDGHENIVDDNNRCEESYNEDSKFSDNSHNQNSHSSDPVGGSAFMTNILTNENKESSKNSESNTTSPQVEKHTSTRNSNKTQLDTTSEEKNTTMHIKRRRGEPKKVEMIVKSELFQKVSKEKANEIEEGDDYATKWKKIDDEIAQYMTLNCEHCDLEFENLPVLRAHMCQVHNIKQGYIKCCKYIFLQRDRLLHHIYLHLDSEIFSCEDCDISFATMYNMRKHFKTKHEDDEDKIYECSVCSKKFVGKCPLKEHKIFVHRDRSATCKSCNKSYNTLKELYEHAFKSHPLKHQGVGRNIVECDLCGTWIRDEEALIKHKKLHMDPKEPCDICHEVFPNRKAMFCHKRDNHRIMHVCGICGKTYKGTTTLKRHMAIHHGKALIHKCPDCHKTYMSYGSLSSHRQKVHPIEYERNRKFRKGTRNLLKQPISTISVLSNGSGETQDLLINVSGLN